MKNELNNDVLINRKILGWEWYKDVNTYKLFTHLIYKANYIDGEHRGTPVMRGQLYTGLDKLKFETGLSVTSIRTSISKLILTGNITSKSTNKYRIITVLKYNTYQLTNKQTDKQNEESATNKLAAYNKDKELLKEIKELKKELLEIKKKEKPTYPKLKYLNFVLLKEGEYDKLVNKLGSDVKVNDYIERLNGHIGSKGTKYKSHYHTILNWYRKDNKPSENRPKLEDY